MGVHFYILPLENIHRRQECLTFKGLGLLLDIYYTSFLCLLPLLLSFWFLLFHFLLFFILVWFLAFLVILFAAHLNNDKFIWFIIRKVLIYKCIANPSIYFSTLRNIKNAKKYLKPIENNYIFCKSWLFLFTHLDY